MQWVEKVVFCSTAFNFIETTTTTKATTTTTTKRTTTTTKATTTTQPITTTPITTLPDVTTTYHSTDHQTFTENKLEVTNNDSNMTTTNESSCLKRFLWLFKTVLHKKKQLKVFIRLAKLKLWTLLVKP